MDTLSGRSCSAIRVGATGITLATLWLALAPRIGHAQAAGTVELQATPPEIATTVSPNLVISLDDSGSMTRNFMPDGRPLTGEHWRGRDQAGFGGSADYPAEGAPFLCAGQIDPRIAIGPDPRTQSMNGVYYNPNVNYAPPLRADGTTPFPSAVFAGAFDNGMIRHWPNINAGVSIARDLTTATLFCAAS